MAARKKQHSDTYKPIKIRGGHPQMIGYARVSKSEQDLGLAAQEHELRKAGVSVIWTETASGASAQPILAQCVESLRKGDTLCVVRLDRLSRRLTKIVIMLDEFERESIYVRAISQGLNTRQRNQKDSMHLLAVLAESERSLIRERTRDGLAEARRRGRAGGHPVKLTPQAMDLIEMLKAKGYSNRKIAEQVKVDEKTVRNALAKLGDVEDPRQMKLELNRAVSQ